MATEYVAGIITVPERVQVVKVPIRELSNHGIPYKLWEDIEHRGARWNQTRMYMELCNIPHKNRHVITMTDDIAFKDGWLSRVTEAMENTDYDVLCLFTNRDLKADDDYGIHRASYKMWFYDQCAVFRKNVLNRQFMLDLIEYATKEERTKKERNHFDCMMSAFLFDSGLKCGTFRPNAVRLQDVPSTLGHKIVIKEN